MGRYITWLEATRFARTFARLKTKAGILTTELSQHRDAATKASTAARKKREEAARTKSNSSKRTALQAAEREETKATQALKKAGDVEKKIGANATEIGRKESSLTGALKDEQRARDREDERRRLQDPRPGARPRGGAASPEREEPRT